jgi:hypothetical protein
VASCADGAPFTGGSLAAAAQISLIAAITIDASRQAIRIAML